MSVDAPIDTDAASDRLCQNIPDPAAHFGIEARCSACGKGEEAMDHTFIP
jgi:hypothetical protein